MHLEEINFLNSNQGEQLLSKYKDLSDEELYRLLMKTDKKIVPFISSIVTLIKLRNKASEKFCKNEEMFFTSVGLEQATNERISEHVSERFKGKKKVIDLTCGIGGNLIFLAKKVEKIIAVDNNEINLKCATLNSKIYGVDKKIKFILGDAFDNIIEDADAFFIDPSREREGKTKTRSILNSEPNILKIIPEIFKVTKNLCVKISPAFDYKEINYLPEAPEIEIISEDNVCKVVLLWFGKFKTCDRRATCIIGNKIYSYINNPQKKIIKILVAPLTYLYEPNKAIIKAHLIEEVAQEFGFNKINQQTSYLTSENIINHKKELFRIFKIISSNKFSLKKIKNELKEKNIERINIITKRFPQKPEDIYKKIKIKEGGNWFLIITVFADEKYHYLFTTKQS